MAGEVKNSQGPMLNPLTMTYSKKRGREDGPSTSEEDDESKKRRRREFKRPDDEDKINELSHRSFALQSKKKIRWAVNMYKDWRHGRILDPFVPCQIKRADLSNLFTFSVGDFEYSVARFIREVKRVDNKDYPPATLREIVIMLQMFMQENGINWKLLDGEQFPVLRNVLDNTMKERTAEGLGSRQSSAIIAMKDENTMFNMGVLGDENAQQLLDTVIYMLGLHLALRGGVEHSRLRRPGFDCQIKIGYDSFGRKRMIYTEDPLQKTNQGGLVGKRSTKTVYVYCSSESRKCPVRIFEKYVRLLPPAKSCKSST